MVMQVFDACAGVAATRTNTMIASVRIGYSVSQHYGAPQFARAISNRLAMSLWDQQVQIVAVFKGEWGCRFQSHVALSGA
jgi:hypothetical protein